MKNGPQLFPGTAAIPNTTRPAAHPRHRITVLLSYPPEIRPGSLLPTAPRSRVAERTHRPASPCSILVPSMAHRSIHPRYPRREVRERPTTRRAPPAGSTSALPHPQAAHLSTHSPPSTSSPAPSSSGPCRVAVAPVLDAL